MWLIVGVDETERRSAGASGDESSLSEEQCLSYGIIEVFY
jgi:hypothetical protein